MAAYPPVAPCSVCGDPVRLNPSQGYVREWHAHRACRRPPASRICPDCGGVKDPRTTRCFPCAMRALRVRPEDDHRSTRRDRETFAPGLSRAQRRRLLAKWRRQRRSCSYCELPATSVDHVVPLIRGGTNFEGNLTPACRACNSRKRARLVIEMRVA